MSISSLIVNKMNTEIILQETYKKLGIEVGQGERAFWNMEYRAGEGGVYGGRACTGFPNITRNLIVREDGRPKPELPAATRLWGCPASWSSKASSGAGRADLVVPKNIFIRQYGLTSFLNYDPEIPEQRDLLREMFELAFTQPHSEDLNFFFNVRKRKLDPNDSDCDVVMSVDYLHLWVMEKGKMHKQDSDFHADASAPSDADVRRDATEIARKYKEVEIIPPTHPEAFAPLHTKVDYVAQDKSGDSRIKLSASPLFIEQIVGTLGVANRIIREYNKDPLTSCLIERGVRIMVRQDSEWVGVANAPQQSAMCFANRDWSVHILGGGRLSSLSVSVNR